ncbi:hypothetical protein AM571_CH00450 [Rhizobium etli 8C-3]|uniref:Uncharacterized protein n=1 Tax=Rhizobium etli 8C-3 TaxID=538025 RepID=A0A1L5NZL9_RHIET|nr:hypothetical protein [Rhizobium etli]APO73301.1 hypothetical protein AM571_CH00450 [Rhizobium etli 8C-3]
MISLKSKWRCRAGDLLIRDISGAMNGTLLKTPMTSQGKSGRCFCEIVVMEQSQAGERSRERNKSGHRQIRQMQKQDTRP